MKTPIKSILVFFFATTCYFIFYRESGLKHSKLTQYDSIRSEENAIVEAFLIEQRNHENSYNCKNGGWDQLKQRWYPHHSQEGGLKTIAYGHKITQGEDFTAGLTESEALALHLKDWEKHFQIAKTDFEAKTGINFEDCCLIGRLIAADIAYNVGNLASYPRFMEALKANNVEEMMNESKTYATIGEVQQELTKRNEFRTKALSFFKN